MAKKKKHLCAPEIMGDATQRRIIAYKLMDEILELADQGGEDPTLLEIRIAARQWTVEQLLEDDGPPAVERTSEEEEEVSPVEFYTRIGQASEAHSEARTTSQVVEEGNLLARALLQTGQLPR